MTSDPSDVAHSLLVDAFSRVRDSLPTLLSGLAADELLWQPDPAANSIAWLTWHLTRVQDDHLAGVGGIAQVWSTGGWATRFALPYPESAIGYGQRAADVAAFDVTDPTLLIGYHQATYDLTLAVLDDMSAADYARVIDTRWDPPVTAAVRLVSVVNDATQHQGQIAYLRGLIERRPQ